MNVMNGHDTHDYKYKNLLLVCFPSMLSSLVVFLA